MFDSFHLSCFLRSSVNWLADISLWSMKLTARDKVNDQLTEYLGNTWTISKFQLVLLVGGMLEKSDRLRAGESVRFGAWLTWEILCSSVPKNQYKILNSSKQFFKANFLRAIKEYEWVWPRKVNYQWLVYKVDKGHPIISNHRCRSRPISDSLQKFGLIYPGTRLPFPPFPSPLPP